MNKFEILVAGVGGQGVLLLGRLLGLSARLSGCQKVIGGEIHGLAQRGGGLASSIRMGEDIYGPIVPIGGADLIMGLEFMEGIRHLGRLAPDGHMVIAETMIPTSGMKMTKIEYPDPRQVLTDIKKITDKIAIFDIQTMASEAGSLTLSNMVLLGATVASVPDFPITTKSIREAIKKVFSEKNSVTKNITAFEMGLRATQTM